MTLFRKEEPPCAAPSLRALETLASSSPAAFARNLPPIPQVLKMAIFSSTSCR